MKTFLGANHDDYWHESNFPLNNFWWDGPQKYENSLGFMSKEFTECADIVGLGCSFTYGDGVMGSTTWGEILADKMNLTYHNISGSGRSTMWAISNFFSYVNQFGNPKIVVALFPEFTRIQVASQPTHMITKNMPEEKKKEGTIIRYALYERFNEGQKYFKLPVVAEEIFPSETAFDVSLQYIKMLEAYCNSNNIKLLWSTWMKLQQEWLEKNITKTQFKNFISSRTWEWHVREEDGFYERHCMEIHPDGEKCKVYDHCHLEYENLYGKNFHVSDDRIDGVRYAHWGVHRHAHTAEIFMKELNDYSPRN